MKRTRYLQQIDRMFGTFKAVALVGPRQCGKTTLARQKCAGIDRFPTELNYFDLEDPGALNRLTDPKLALQDLQGLVVIDEIQRRPDLFPVLRFLLDRPENKMQLLILGSASRDLIRQTSESLAGRLCYIEISPFGIDEGIPQESIDDLWLRGGFPPAFLSSDADSAFLWLREYIRSYLERDIPALGISIPAETLRRFWVMLTHNHANILNLSDLGRSFGASDTTIKRYLDILTGTFMVRQLQPYHANLKKRQVKAPKIYIRDSGVLHSLMGIESQGQLKNHIRLGASWEGFAMEQTIKSFEAAQDRCFFWGIHSQSEIDLLLETSEGLKAFEFKYADQPKVTTSIRSALKHLPIDQVTIVTPGRDKYQLDDQVVVSGCYHNVNES